MQPFAHGGSLRAPFLAQRDGRQKSSFAAPAGGSCTRRSARAMARGGLLSGATARGVLKHRGLGAPLQGRDATHQPQFSFRFERCVKRHKSWGRRGVSSASRHCAPSRAAWTTQGSGAAGKSADPLMCNVRARIIEGGNKVGSVRGPWPTPENVI